MPSSRRWLMGRPEARVSRELRRLLVDPARLAPTLRLEPAEHHYLARVLRCRSGDRFAVVDGAGRLWSARYAASATAELEQPLDAPLELEPPPAWSLQLAVALPRRDADVLLRMATELGVDRIQPLHAERSVPADAGGTAGGRSARQDRWTAILREAAEQCERLWLPQLAEPQTAERWLGRPVLAGAWLATTRHPGMALLSQELEQLPAPPRGELSLAIGPEGGWSPAEEQAALRAGWRPVSMGPTILRTATAAAAGLALMASWRAALPREPTT